MSAIKCDELRESFLRRVASYVRKFLRFFHANTFLGTIFSAVVNNSFTPSQVGVYFMTLS